VLRVFFFTAARISSIAGSLRGANCFPPRAVSRCVDELLSTFVVVCFVRTTYYYLSCVSSLHASTPLRHGFGLDCGLPGERLRPVRVSGAAQRLLEQHEPQVSTSLHVGSPMLMQCS